MVGEIVAIILARGGSKGIPNKNLIEIAGRPLIDWTVLQLQSAGVHEIYVSTDSDAIAARAQHLGTKTISRPAALATDDAVGDLAAAHAIESIGLSPDSAVLLPQLTSPLRHPNHLSQAIDHFHQNEFDSLFSGIEFEDICVWGSEPSLTSITYDYRSRGNRQQNPLRILENGSFYISKVGGLLSHRNRLHGVVGYFPMPKWTMPEIDDQEDLRLCHSLMEAFKVESGLRFD